MKITAAGKFWFIYVLALALCVFAVVHFKKAHPCPANGATKGACPGYVVDHIVPLCACGPDAPSNMQWQDLKTSKAKDVLERKQCGGKGD